MKWKTLFEPEVNVYGLSISYFSVRLVGLEKNGVRKERAAFSPGVFKNGKLKDWKPLLRALIILRSKFKKINGKMPVVFSLPECGVQLRRFNLPSGAKDDISALAALNLQAISPIDIRDAYYDWQRLDGEFLGAFVHRGIVEQYLWLLNEAGFAVLAVEFPALALARLIKERASALDLSRPHLVAFVSDDGLEFLVIKNGNLYSRYFMELDSVKDFDEALVKGAETAIGQEAVNNLILIAPAGLYKKIEQTIKERLSYLRIKPLALPQFFDVAPNWYVGLGSALRGIGRGEKWIDLSPHSSQSEMWKFKKQILVSTWRKLIFKISASAAVLLLAGAVSANFISSRLEEKISANSQSAEFQEAQFLKKIQTAKVQSNDFSGVLENLRVAAAQNKIEFARLIVKGEERKIILNGLATREADVIKFKDQLTAIELFKEIILPLSEIITDKDGGVRFVLTLNF
jgi:hypothetical protein